MNVLSRISLLTALLLVLAGVHTATYAQSSKGGNKGNKEKPEKVEKKGQAPADSMQRTGIPDTLRNKGQGKAKADSGKKNRGQGNAYGKEKGDMSGREFGQARAAAAKKLQEEISALDQKVDEGEEVVKRARNDIQQAEENLENADADSTVINRRQEHIEKAKEQLSELEQMLENQKVKLSKARERFEELTGKKPQAEADSSATAEEAGE